jgi:hypothetical protein
MEERRRPRPFWYLRRRPEAVASEIDDELRVHLEMRVEELTAGGMPAEDARREALRQFGDLEQTRMYCRREDEKGENRVQRSLMLQDFAQDVRIAIRSLLRTPVLALTIVMTIGLGIGATTAIFCAVNATLLRPLPYAEPGRLVRIPRMRLRTFRLSAVDYLAVEAQQTHFERIAAYTGRTLTFSDGRTSDLVQGKMVSWAYLGVLKIRPALGRDFTEADGREGSPRAAIVSHGFWQQRLGGRADAIGKPVRLDGADYTLAGVLPAEVGPLEQRQEFFIVQQFPTPPRRGPFPFIVVARLRPGVARPSRRQARDQQADLSIGRLVQDDGRRGDHGSEVPRRGRLSKTAGLALAAVALVG